MITKRRKKSLGLKTDNNLNIRNHNNIKIIVPNVLKGIQAVRIEFFFILKVANIRCFILIAVEIFHNIIRK